MKKTNELNVSVEQIEVFADKLDAACAAEIYQEYGCLVVRGLMKPYLEALQRDFEASAKQALSLLDQAKIIPEGWTTPDGTLWLPAPKNFHREQQIMVLGMRYSTSGTFLQSALDTKLLDIVEGIVGPNIELFMNGQCLYKEPVGGHPKHLHQDASYFEHRFEGPVAILNYAVDTNLQNGALYVVPGSHKLGMLEHIDTFSHLGLDEKEWPGNAPCQSAERREIPFSSMLKRSTVRKKIIRINRVPFSFIVIAVPMIMWSSAPPVPQNELMPKSKRNRQPKTNNKAGWCAVFVNMKQSPNLFHLSIIRRFL